MTWFLENLLLNLLQRLRFVMIFRHIHEWNIRSCDVRAWPNATPINLLSELNCCVNTNLGGNYRGFTRLRCLWPLMAAFGRRFVVIAATASESLLATSEMWKTLFWRQIRGAKQKQDGNGETSEIWKGEEENCHGRESREEGTRSRARRIFLATSDEKHLLRDLPLNLFRFLVAFRMNECDEKIPRVDLRNHDCQRRTNVARWNAEN